MGRDIDTRFFKRTYAECPRLFGVACLLGIWLGACTAHAQWLTQHIPLLPGWNAVYLDVQPEPVFCAQIFSGWPVESVWKWDRHYTSVQFTEDPETLIPEDPHWLVWLPPDHPQAFLGRLFALQGCQAYLIKVASNAAPFVLALKGKAMIPAPESSLCP